MSKYTRKGAETIVDKEFDPSIDNERIYDDKIAPLLRQVGKLCRENGIPFAASFQFSSEDIATVASIPAGTPSRSIARAILMLARPSLEPLPVEVRSLNEGDAEIDATDKRPFGQLWNLCNYWMRSHASPDTGVIEIGTLFMMIATLVEVASVWWMDIQADKETGERHAELTKMFHTMYCYAEQIRDQIDATSRAPAVSN